MEGILARVVMVGSWVDDAVWMELLHGGSLRLFLFFLRPLCNTQEKIKCKHELFRRIFFGRASEFYHLLVCHRS